MKLENKKGATTEPQEKFKKKQNKTLRGISKMFAQIVAQTERI